MMYMKINGVLHEVVIIKKRTTKNTYMRVKEDGKIYVTTNLFISDKKVIKILEEHAKNIAKMVLAMEQKKKYDDSFYYLGKKYDVVFMPGKEIKLGDTKVFIGRDADLKKWYLEEAKRLFQVHLDDIYQKFQYRIPYPGLRIRKMKSRWGVCNTKTHIVTLNLELIRKNPMYLDYVIVHELSHLVVGNHSKAFWSVVEKHTPNYKEIRKEMKEYQ